jgi:hypothetical protein
VASLTRSGSKKFAIAVAAAFAFACSVASAGADAQRECSWGASTVMATFENGQIVETPPQTFGCT